MSKNAHKTPSSNPERDLNPLGRNIGNIICKAWKQFLARISCKAGGSKRGQDCIKHIIFAKPADRAITLSLNTAGMSMPSSRAAQDSPSRWRSQPYPAVHSSRKRDWQDMASRIADKRASSDDVGSSIAFTNRTECSLTGLMFSVRPRAKSLKKTFWEIILVSG